MNLEFKIFNLECKKANDARLTYRRGYTLLFAVLVASLVLGVAVFILSISRKQYILSSTARNSMYALYAADSGLECLTAAANNSLEALSTSTVESLGGTGGALRARQPQFFDRSHRPSVSPANPRALRVAGETAIRIPPPDRIGIGQCAQAPVLGLLVTDAREHFQPVLERG